MKLFSSQTYTDRRRNLKGKVNSGLIILMGNDEAPMNYTDNIYRFRQDSSFLYFFGLNQAGLAASIDVDSGEEVLYGNEYTMTDIIWVGPQPTIASKAEKVGISSVKPYSKMAETIQKAMAAGRTIHYLPPYRHANTQKLASWMSSTINKVEAEASVSLIKAIVAIRSIKTSEEIVEMTDAVNISRDMHMAAMRSIADGKYEYEVVGDIYATAKRKNCYLAYPAIFSINGQTLHNHYHNNKMTSGRLALNDSGAENEMCYAGDITRTMPVSGKFSDKQKEIYNIVYDMEETSIQSLKAGISYRDIHIASNELMLGRLVDLGLLKGDAAEMNALGIGGLFMPHGLGHMIGLDVHDMEDLGEDYVGYREGLERSTALGLKSLRLAKELEAGNVITVEPGVYFIPELIEKWKAEGKFSDHINYDKLASYYDFGGIRLEDNILVTEDGHTVLGKHIPKTIAEVEDTMAS